MPAAMPQEYGFCINEPCTTFIYNLLYIEDNKTQFKFCASSHRLICCR